MTRCAYIGNFKPDHSTENHVARALAGLGVATVLIQEDSVQAWASLASKTPDVDFILWTRTGWNWDALGWNKEIAHSAQISMLWRADRSGVPVVSFHLDRWWGLEREYQVLEEPFFATDLVITADGGHEAEWADAHVKHQWMPPAVSAQEAQLGRARGDYAWPVAFVGSWRPGYHLEWTHRPHLIEWLRTHYGDRLGLYPEIGLPPVRGQDLQDLYASTLVNVGDSCMVGDGGYYWSDRIPETLGRGGFLLHPNTPGLQEAFPYLPTWEIGDWDRLRYLIDYYLANEGDRRMTADLCRGDVLTNHTYEVRMAALLRLLGLRTDASA